MMLAFFFVYYWFVVCAILGYISFCSVFIHFVLQGRNISFCRLYIKNTLILYPLKIIHPRLNRGELFLLFSPPLAEHWRVFLAGATEKNDFLSEKL